MQRSFQRPFRVREALDGRNPAEVQAAVHAAAADATAAQRLAAEMQDDVCHRRLTAEGVEIIPAAALDRAAFMRAAG